MPASRAQEAQDSRYGRRADTRPQEAPRRGETVNQNVHVSGVTLEGRLVNASSAPIAGALLDVLVKTAGTTSSVIATASTPFDHVVVPVGGEPSRAIIGASRTAMADARE